MSLFLKLNINKGSFRMQTDLELPGDRLTAVFGPSGCGKTTLLRTIAGLEKAAGNRIELNDTVWQDDDHWLPVHQRGVGLVFQKPALFSHLTVEKNLRYGWKRRPHGREGLSMSEATELLGIGHLLKRAAASLSGGEGQRVSIARALVSAPSLLLLDEPLSALDEQSKQSILPYLERIHRRLRLPVLYVSHSLEEIARLADFIVLMEHGRVIHSGPAGALLSDPAQAFARHRHAQSILEANVLEYDPVTSTCRVKTGAGELLLAADTEPLERTLRLRIQARDISIALHRVEETSVLNLLPATITTCTAMAGGYCLLSLQVGERILLSRITRLSAERLHLRPGMNVIAQIKSAALLGERSVQD